MTTINSRTIIAHHYLLYSNPHLAKLRKTLQLPKPLTPRPLNKNISTQKHHRRLVPLGLSEPSDSDQDPLKAFDWLKHSLKKDGVQKLIGIVDDHRNQNHRKVSRTVHSVIKNDELRRFIEMIEDRCQFLRYVPFSVVRQWCMRNQGIVVLASLMAFLMKHVELIVRMAEEEPEVGLRLTLACDNDKTLGPANISTSHFYQGKIFLRNAKILIAPLLQLGTLTKKMVDSLAHVIEKAVPQSMLRGGRKNAFLAFSLALLTLLFMVVSIVLLRRVLVK